MVAHRSSSENTPNDYSSSDPDIDRLHADLDDAERRIADALAPEPMDWETQYREILASVAATAARFEKGGA